MHAVFITIDIAMGRERVGKCHLHPTSRNRVQVVGVTKEERVEIKLREVKGLLVAMMQCGRLKVPEEQKQYQAVDGDLSKARLLSSPARAP